VAVSSFSATHSRPLIRPPPTPAGFPNFPPHNAHFPACPAPDLLFGVVFALCAADEVSSASFKRVLCESFALKI